MTENLESFEYRLEPNKELRFYLRSDDEPLIIEVKSGKAEVFGAELEVNKKYTFAGGARISIFTYSGCIVEILRRSLVHSKSNPHMMFYLSCHSILERLRERATATDERGPIVLIVGPKDSGKSTLASILTNYAVRMNHTPVLVETDPGQSYFSLPGTIGAALVTRQIIDMDVDSYPQLDPLVFTVGSARLSSNPMYKKMISNLGSVTLDKLNSNKKARTSGLIINTPGYTVGEGFNIIKHTAESFQVDVILVAHQKNLFDELEKHMPPSVKVVQVPKSEGSSFRSFEARLMLRNQMMHNYFYGPKSELRPYLFDVAWNTLNVYEIQTQRDGNNSEEKSVLHPAPLIPNIKDRLLAISFAENFNDVLESPISGFICISDLSLVENRVTVLSPQPPPLPKAYFLMTYLHKNLENRIS